MAMKARRLPFQDEANTWLGKRDEPAAIAAPDRGQKIRRGKL